MHHLPFGNPLINTYPQHANLTAIIDTKPDYRSWIYNAYLNIAVYKESIERLDFCIGYNTDRVNRNCPLIICHGMNDLMISKIGGLIKSCIYAIESGYYVTCMINELYISAYDSYKMNNYYHDILLIGFDLEKRAFLAADHFTNGKHDVKEIGFDEFEQGYLSAKDNKNNYVDSLEFIQLKESVNWFFSIYDLVENIKQYLSSQCPLYNVFDVFSGHINTSKYAFGIDVAKHLCNYISNIDNSINHLIFHALLTHEKYFERLIVFLYDSGYLSLSRRNIFLKLIYESINLANTLLNLSLKFNVRKNLNITCRMIKMINDLFSIKKLLLDELLNTFIPNDIFISSESIAIFLDLDSKTQGDWIGIYGRKGYMIIGFEEDLLNITIRFGNDLDYAKYIIWDENTVNKAALLCKESCKRNIARLQRKHSIEMYINIDQKINYITLYCVDYENLKRSQTIEIYDRTNDKLLDLAKISDFQNGIYIRFEANGNLKIVISPLNGASNVVLSAIFFD